MEDTQVMRLWDLPPRLRRATEAKCVAEESLHSGPEGPLCESVKVKPGLFGYYMRLEMPEPKDTCQATDTEWKQLKRQKCAVTKAGRVESSQSSDIRLGVFPAGFAVWLWSSITWLSSLFFLLEW